MLRLLFVAVFFCFIQGYTANLCNQYHTLPHTKDRSVYNTADHTPLNPRCDNKLVAGWYAFEYYASIPTSCPAPYSCGTLLPVWINGTHPMLGEGPVTRKACVTAGSSSCCSTTIDIGVMNCGAYFMYYLEPTPGCPVAYCSDFKDAQSPTVDTTLTTVGHHWITFA
ncbi:pancreatic secretory granule membrane major glycoprotein GP2-like [Argopecten irradians]|uniref:pancreatic secretory granule membrane major glycoprotein GP2-like n=1 Tax=Argopecten irradians TaxID=31199 RepID=UPI0037138780